MSDDYHDDDSRSGGLWDPDALSPPPAPSRPLLHAVPPSPSDDVASSATSLAPAEERLVRLDEFRPVLEDDTDLTDRAGTRTWRRAMLAAAVALAISAAAATGVARLTSDDHDPSKPAGLATRAPDVEQAALTRTVKSDAGRSRSRPGAKHRRGTSGNSSTASRDKSLARPKSTQPTTLVSQRAADPAAPTDAATRASSSPARAQHATAACEFPPC